MKYSMPLKELLAIFAIDSELELEVSGLAIDSRKVSAGHVFFAYKGLESDGRDYILAAQQAGAIAVVYEAHEAELPRDVLVPTFAVQGLSSMIGFAASAFYQEPSQALQVFGVTGTNGKTTCCYLLVQALTGLGMQAAMMGTIGVGKLGSLSDSGMTTPDPISIQQTLADLRDQGVTQVAMEVSSHALDQGRVNGIDFFCTLFTNLTHDHLDYHGDMSSYGLAKQRLFTDFQSELVVTNAADEFGARMIDVAKSEFIVQYGQGGDVFADDVRLNQGGIAATVDAGGIEFDIKTPLIGQVNVANLELLIATLLALSTSIEDIQRIVSELTPAPGRMELYRTQGSSSVVVDYAHTPDALEKALASVKQHCEGQLWCVFGCGGDRDASKRPLMGAIATKYADRSIITNDNPRTEEPEAIATQIAEGADMAATCETVLDRSAAIQRAIVEACEQDWVLVAGKGHEATQTIGTKVVPFSDREQVLLALGLESNSAAGVSS